jgi:hypothetical protein
MRMRWIVRGPGPDQQTGRSQIREADAAHARNNPFFSATCGRCISNGESK